ncbi:ly6/PLAUR domain-containing protein 8-like isoform X1 [Ranitomeya imitator]|uniref:ly6/PLAUR domain-containing protein 8-like isoform X1 n=2 Tax=Ranitomeya imitator TaxID=111125 RepID=UPI0037E8A260
MAQTGDLWLWGTCLVCETCHEDDCNDMTSVTCDSSVKRCFNSLEVKKTEEGETRHIHKSGAKKEQLCDLTFSMSAGDEVYYVSKCCNGDHCNGEEMEMPPINETENNNECPVCYANAKSCTPKGNMTCQGAHTECTKFSVMGDQNGKTEKWAFQGCTTKNFLQRWSFNLLFFHI